MKGADLMADILPFSAFFIARDDGSTLHAGWLPDASRRMLLGISCDYQEGAGVMLEPAAAVSLAEALRARQFRRIEGGAVSVRTANRGDPYIDGMEVTLDLGDYSSLSVFLDHDRAGRLAEILSGPSS
jgi:hypothetical protein